MAKMDFGTTYVPFREFFVSKRDAMPQLAKKLFFFVDSYMGQ